MSNIGSSALTSSKQKSAPTVPAMGQRQQQFDQGTMSLLDNARQVVEGAVGQGQQLNPLIYQLLGLNPQVEDHSADLQSAQGEMDAAQKQFDEAQKTIATLKGIPGGKRSPAQKKQLAQLSKQMPNLQSALGRTKDTFSHLQTMPKTITGFTKLDPKDIPAESPFSALNPLNQANATEQQRLNQYLNAGATPGGTGASAAIDPTLVHQYDQAEQALRAKLSQRFGPDYENSSVGQMALQTFSREKSNAFATWNQQQVQNYNAMAFGGAGALQSLLGGQINLMREPESTGIASGNALNNLAAQRLAQQQTAQQWLLGHAGVSTNVSSAAPLIGGLGSLLTTPYNSQGDTLGKTAGSAVGSAASAIGSGASSLYNWATGAGAGADLSTGAGAAAADAAAGGAGDALAF